MIVCLLGRGAAEGVRRGAMGARGGHMKVAGRRERPPAGKASRAAAAADAPKKGLCLAARPHRRERRPAVRPGAPRGSAAPAATTHHRGVGRGVVVPQHVGERHGSRERDARERERESLWSSPPSRARARVLVVIGRARREAGLCVWLGWSSASNERGAARLALLVGGGLSPRPPLHRAGGDRETARARRRGGGRMDAL